MKKGYVGRSLAYHCVHQGPYLQMLKQCQSKLKSNKCWETFLSKRFLIKSNKKVKQCVKLAWASNLKNGGTLPTVSMVSFSVEETSVNIRWEGGAAGQGEG